MDNEQQNFLRYWFSGFINGLEQVDQPAQDTILRSCGLACAQSYTAQAFVDARQQSRDLPDFLEQLRIKFPEAVYTRLDERTLAVTYSHCGCDLVRLGWVKAPILCRCSATNLQQNFQKALGLPVQVQLKSSILGGAEQCVFEVILSSERDPFERAAD